jgi:hypothetical protein
MTPERYEQIESLYHAVRERSSEERAKLLSQADPEVRREVESLLAQPGRGEFIDHPAIKNADVTNGADDATATLVTTGTRLGPYQIESKLGEGGMGEVFRAVDTRLGRAVAVKTTQEKFSDRFEREARAISSLNHPHICTLYDVGPNYLVMELVEGETLAAKLKSGPLPIPQALEYASQIGAALEEAHGKGIIHRDLKPGNIMIAKAGVKVLDFGLAKLESDETATASRMIMGTPAYMAPEQREGKPADARSDIYSFGCVLYEMLTGAKITAQRKRLPSKKLEAIVNRCLEEDPQKRWQSVAELDRELKAVATAQTPWMWIGAGAAALVLLAGAYFYFNSHRAPALTDKDTIVLADFDNKTGDTVFDETLRQALAIELQQSPFIEVVSDADVQKTLALMGRPKDARLTAEIAQQVCERTASAATLEGSITSLGSTYVVGLKARNCNTGTLLEQDQIQVAKREDVLNSLSQLARKFRTKAGESLATVEKHSTPLEQATTPSLEALKAYSAGMKANLTLGNQAGAPYLRRAIELDPNFAAAYAVLGISYSSMGESELAAEITTKEWKLRDRVSDPEKYLIDFTYDRQVTGNLENAYQTLETWDRAYPRNATPSPKTLMAALAGVGTGRFEKSIELAGQVVKEDPGRALAYANLAFSYFLTGRFAEAEATIQTASARKIELPEFMVIGYNISALNGDRQGMDRAVSLAKGKRRAEHWIAHAEALELARSGRLVAARQSSIRAMDFAIQEGEREAAASYSAARALWEAACENPAEAKKAASAALELSKGRDVEYPAALALAVAGDSPRAETLAADLEKRFPEDTFAKFGYVPVLRGFAALKGDKPAESVQLLEAALHYELAANGLNFNHLYLGGLHSAYVRGEALLAQHRYPDAAKEFQKMLDHRGIVGLDPMGALARWRLGKTYALAGDKAKAKTAYEDFFALWKDADLGIPILKQAKAEFTKLQ